MSNPTNDTLTWRISDESGTTMVDFIGDIDHSAEFAPLVEQLSGPVVFRLGQLRRLNSSGVREWILFVRALPNVSTLAFSHCSIDFVRQLNMIYNLRGAATVRSFYAPYRCPGCGADTEKLLDVEACFPDRKIDRAPTFACERCGVALELDDLPDHYFHFVTTF